MMKKLISENLLSNIRIILDQQDKISDLSKEIIYKNLEKKALDKNFQEIDLNMFKKVINIINYLKLSRNIEKGRIVFVNDCGKLFSELKGNLESDIIYPFSGCMITCEGTDSSINYNLRFVDINGKFIPVLKNSLNLLIDKEIDEKLVINMEKHIKLRNIIEQILLC